MIYKALFDFHEGSDHFDFPIVSMWSKLLSYMAFSSPKETSSSDGFFLYSIALKDFPLILLLFLFDFLNFLFFFFCSNFFFLLFFFWFYYFFFSFFLFFFFFFFDQIAYFHLYLIDFEISYLIHYKCNRQ